jgi:hypothetical protein
MTPPLPPSEYYQETVTVYLDRVTLLTITQACMIALTHPAIPGTVMIICKDALKQFIPLVNEYAPKEVLQRWQRTLDSI